jgi:hypothetical protein
MTNPDESIDYLNRLEGPIVEALAAMEAGRLPHAIKVGEAFLAAKNIVVKDAIKTNTGRKGDNWSNWLSRICKRQRISVRTAHDYMLLARHADVSQRAASVRHALEQIAAKREAEGKKRAAPPAKSTKSAAASPDLTELLRNVGPDELRDALRRDMARRHWSVSRSTRSRRHVPSGSSGHQIPGRMRWCGCSPG